MRFRRAAWRDWQLRLRRRSELAEYKLEVNCRRNLANEAMEVIRRVHPYEEPIINIIPLVNRLFE